jgi:hypothetical protein
LGKTPAKAKAVPLAAGTPGALAAAPTRTRFAPGPRTLAILAVLAALSVTAAVLVWVVPLPRRGSPAPSDGPGTAPEPAGAAANAHLIADGSPPDTAQETRPDAPGAAPTEARDAGSSAPNAPSMAASDAGLVASPDAPPAPPKRRGDEWRVDPKQPSPDVVPLNR